MKFGDTAATYATELTEKTPWHRLISPVVLAAIWFTAVYLPVTIAIAARRQLWNDELFTYYIARLAPQRDIWNALMAGADQNPPLFYILTHYAMSSFANDLLAIRLPEIIGFWLMGVSLILLISKHAPAWYGLAAGLFTLVTGAYPYAYEARPYALVLGFAAFALLCWRNAVGRRAWAFSVGLGIGLALAVSMHYYSVVIFAPIVAGELFRSWQRRNLWTPVWLGVAIGCTPLLLYLPLIRSASSYGATFWAKATVGSLGAFIWFLMYPATLPLVAFAIYRAFTWLRNMPGARPKTAAGVYAPIAEVVAVCGYMALPVLAIVLGRAVTGAYTHRYAIAAVVGTAVTCAWLLSSAFGGRTRPALYLCSLLTVFFLARDGRSAPSTAAAHDRRSHIEFLNSQRPADTPIAIADPHLFSNSLTRRLLNSAGVCFISPTQSSRSNTSAQMLSIGRC